ncbi:hypothetical protein MYAM1_002791 [Malassezia yamatoensis]|uniref:Uncharacterized protein n=1 Tax=Malassezia yamatoensis TaxID=253288 RepID=A0AAJ5Z0K3_9BASI|nr:hypothetical protein MYAM1_002791 [Malassezia yamatoensis]
MKQCAAVLRRSAQVVRLPASAFQPPNPAAYVHRRAAAQFRSDLFLLRLYPLHIDLNEKLVRMPRVLGPPWLPWPPNPETHDGRHMLLYKAAQAMLANEPDRLRILRTTVFVSKKNVHKLAVVRNRCRTRLIAALRDLVAQEAVIVADRYVYVFLAQARLYSAPISEIADTLRHALKHVSKVQNDVSIDS